MLVDFRKMRGRLDLHVFLACPEESARQILERADLELFKVHELPKKGRKGETRVVWEVRDQHIADIYKGLSRRLRVFLETLLPGFPHPASHGYVPQRSTFTNAKAHIGSPAVLKADIHRFFETVPTSKVVALLEHVGVCPEAARILAAVVTRNDHLPLGLHTSPVLANAVCHELDGRLTALCPGGVYTRYADDLSFSGPQLPTKTQVAAELRRLGFDLSERKWRLVKRGRGLYVTGLSLEDGNRPRVPREMKRRLRQDLYYAGKFGLDHHTLRRGRLETQRMVNWIHGTIQYTRGIEPELGLRLHDQWTKILHRSPYRVDYPSSGDSHSRAAVFLVDESVIESRGRRILVLCLVVLDAATAVRESMERILDDLKADPYSAVIALHWNQLSQDGRTEVTPRIRSLPLRCFLAYAQLANGDRDTYDATYARLLRLVFTDRLLKYDKCTVEVLVEENSKVLPGTPERVVSEVYAALGGRKPLEMPSCHVVSKPAEPALPLPDLVLGVFGDFARSKERAEREVAEKKKQVSGAQSRQRYEQLRDKIRAIYDADTGAVYSRKTPFEPF